MTGTKAAQYAQALKAHSSDPDEGKSFADKLVAYLVATKREKLLPAIRAAYERIHASGTRGARIIVARESAMKTHAQDIEADLRALGLPAQAGAEKAIQTVDDSLIGGYIVRTPKEQIDKSYRTALLNLYSRITS